MVNDPKYHALDLTERSNIPFFHYCSSIHVNQILYGITLVVDTDDKFEERRKGMKQICEKTLFLVSVRYQQQNSSFLSFLLCTIRGKDLQRGALHVIHYSYSLSLLGLL